MVSGIGSNSSYAMQMPKPEEMFKRADKNGDGGIDKSEFKESMTKMKEITGMDIDTDKIFTKLDTNNDGKIDESEGKSAKNAMPPIGMGSFGVKTMSKNSIDMMMKELFDKGDGNKNNSKNDENNDIQKNQQQNLMKAMMESYGQGSSSSASSTLLSAQA